MKGKKKKKETRGEVEEVLRSRSVGAEELENRDTLVKVCAETDYHPEWLSKQKEWLSKQK